ncbi:hypothetical protein CTEN210_03057 [Chaetoceros tenuissimus]|uniref:Strictosidine synthase conserved region domain-containing protein n=1 Tax=Chaetoceros tenuissimus TaxID=426638 RepID=A0AAD3CIP1_9STRA|nr:hypothetical protein CTEN210_03057 [Chaetoceros tenuissimus]
MLNIALKFFIYAVAVLAIYIKYRLTSAGVSPVSSPLPELPNFPTKDLVVNITGKVEKLHVHDLVGPECIIPTIHKGKELLFVSLADGRIARVTQSEDGTTSVSTLTRTGSIPIEDTQTCKGDPHDSYNSEQQCGRPLGMYLTRRSRIDPDFTNDEQDEDVLLVADAYQGLLMVDAIYEESKTISRVKTLATRSGNDDPDYSFHLLNAVLEKNGIVYFTETSKAFQRRRIFHAVFDGKPTGRLMKYSKDDGVQVLAENIYMANGLTFSHDEKSLIIVSGIQLLKYSLEEEAMSPEPFVNVIPGTGDNIEHFDSTPSGRKINCYWLGLGSKFAKPKSLLKLVSEKPMLKSILCALVPYKTIVELIPKLSALLVLDEDGNIIEVYQDVSNTAVWLSEGRVLGDYIYLGSWYNPFLARFKKAALA